MERVNIGDLLVKMHCGWKDGKEEKGRYWMIYSAIANTSRNVENMLGARAKANT